MKREFLDLLHKSHQGVVSTKLIARDSIFWPGIMTDIENTILNCLICQKYAKSNTREPLQPHEVPELPWQKIGVDFKSLGPLNFIVVVDYFSKFIIVNKLANKTAETVISSLKNIFAINGLPQQIFSDNGPPFSSREFINFASKYNINLMTSSPHYPMSNGMIERAIQTVKGLLVKSYEVGDDPFLAILNYNVTPKEKLPSPSQLLMGRRLRTTLPIEKSLLFPKYSLKGVRKKLQLRQTKQKNYFDKKSRKLPKLNPNQPILMQRDIRCWEPGMIVKESGPNDYLIKLDDANYRRNRKSLRPLRTSILADELNVKYSEEMKKPEETECVPPQSEHLSVNVNNNTRSNISPEPDYVNVNNNSKTNVSQTCTRSGRVIKPPLRLNLSF